jgi:hypothetical protein
MASQITGSTSGPLHDHLKQSFLLAEYFIASRKQHHRVNWWFSETTNTARGEENAMDERDRLKDYTRRILLPTGG